MESTVLDDVKVQIAMAGLGLIDNRLVNEINMNLMYLAVNNIPVCEIDKNTTSKAFYDIGLKKEDYMSVLSYVSADIKILENLKVLNDTSIRVLNTVKARNLSVLKVRYDSDE